MSTQKVWAIIGGGNGGQSMAGHLALLGQKVRLYDVMQKTVDELNNELVSLKEELFHLRFQNAINQLENPMRIKAVKKDIARVKTILREYEIKDAKSQGTEG